YKPIDDLWPSREDAAASRLFSPISVGSITLSQRTWVPAMVPWRSNEEGEVTSDVLDWYRRFAVGRPGAIVIEATGIRDVPSGPLLRIGDDRYIEGLTKPSNQRRRRRRFACKPKISKGHMRPLQLAKNLFFKAIKTSL
ncbi:hypothetical protein N9R09_03870, partial [Porticoccaceae bacterium]|nr:hypothetical protein [Porticoccaceae bacterium]